MPQDPRDYPMQECIDVAEELIAKGCNVYMKYTCAHCGSRQTISTPNKFFTSGKCEACGETTDNITHCNYVLTGPGSVIVEHLRAKSKKREVH